MGSFVWIFIARKCVEEALMLAHIFSLFLQGRGVCLGMEAREGGRSEERPRESGKGRVFVCFFCCRRQGRDGSCFSVPLLFLFFADFNSGATFRSLLQPDNRPDRASVWSLSPLSPLGRLSLVSLLLFFGEGKRLEMEPASP